MEVMRARRSGAAIAVKPRKGRTLPLRPTETPVVAIVWKNTLCFFRTWQPRVFISPLIVGVMIGVVSGGSGNPATVVFVSALALTAMLLVFGGRMIRNDLRHDMLHLPMLKTLPLRGR